MSNILKLDEAVQCVKALVNNNLCGICDIDSGKRLRYPCGHSACDVCVAKSNNCLLCLTPPESTASALLEDNPATQRVKNAGQLLKTFQEAFKVDIFKRQRISDQLKLEKELFPECIQAPQKYYNKRKSYSPRNKENKGTSFFPGEQISPIKVLKMENSLNYVQQWLDKNEKKKTRKPFADLNQQNTGTPRKTKVVNKVNKISENVAKRKKPSSFKSSLAVLESQSLLDQYYKTVEPKQGKKIDKIKNSFNEMDEKELNKLNKTDKDESGIVMDDEPIVIDDSQSIIDKDKLAWMAVLEANNKDPYNSQTERLSQVTSYTKEIIASKIDETQLSVYRKVPFYKKSYLTEPCCLCNTNKSENIDSNQKDRSKDVSITIENKSFIAKINVTTVPNKPVFEKHSVPIQTDISGLNDSGCVINENLPDKSSPDGSNVKEMYGNSEDLFTAEAKICKSIDKNNIKQLVIEDSDSDDLNESSILEVAAEVHQSSEKLELGVLSEVHVNEVQNRSKRSQRGHTPNSTDSSEKENYDPNRAKRAKLDKKTLKKIKRNYDMFELNSIHNFE